MSQKFFYYLGNLLIFLSLFLLFLIYFPFLKMYLFPSQSLNKLNSSFYINIPKIKAQAPIIANVDPFDKAAYLKELELGVAQAKGSALPGEKGTVFLFAHSSDVPWRITKYNIAFFRLGELQKNDKVYVYKDGKEYKYDVFDKKEVWPQEIQYLKMTTDNVLVLQTCTPIGTSLKRLLVFARQEKI